ncbi:acyl-CoA dehydratase activase [Enterococcus hailinensis]|uniref:acyl-CoA dehydratase activase n=1 Tax=Enterococcus hailinensis TaxID=3238988 RepID=UPI0038B35919
MKLVTTGYGRKLIPADLVVTEITCHGKGAEYLFPGVTQVIDIGGQDCKTIQLNGKGSVTEFSMNDRCAAGTGRFVEVMMRTLGEEIADLDTFVQAATPITINSMCTVFAESEVISLISKGEEREDIALGVLHSIAQRISSQYSKLRPKHGETILFTGGLSKSTAFSEVLANYVLAPVQTDELSQFAGAIGAAQIGIKKL